MKKAIIASLSLGLGCGLAGANFCARDIVPAATLLFPYVTVDIAGDAPSPDGWTTVTAITNVARDAVIVHFTVWDAASVPRFNFDEILSGYDVLVINWRDVLKGRFDLFDTSSTPFAAVSVPSTYDPFEWGPDGRGRSGVSRLTTPQNRNAISGATACSGLLPYGNRPDLSARLIGTLKGVLVAYSHAGCGQRLRADKTPWAPAGNTGNYPLYFYVTVDVVNTCNLTIPDSAAYWTSYATSNNVLIGDMSYVHARNGNVELLPAVHIEAVNSVTRATTYPFYGERVDAETHREPLGSAFGFRYANAPAEGISTSVVLWKNFAEILPAGKVDDCGSYMYYAWDNDERSLSRPTPWLPFLQRREPNQFPLATQQVPLNTRYFDLPAANGWMLIVLPPSYVFSARWLDPTGTTSATGTTAAPRYYMGWAGVRFVHGSHSTSIEAATVASTMCYASQVLPHLGANPGATIANGFGVIARP